jgi:hypothetical protein
LFRECDAIVVTTSYVYESASLDPTKQWLSNIRKKYMFLDLFCPLVSAPTTKKEQALIL